MAHAGEKLGFRLARGPGFLFRPLAFFDVDRDAEPGVDVSQSVAPGPALLEKPAIFPVLSSQPQLDLEVLSLTHTRLQGAGDAVAVFGMYCGSPAVAERLSFGETGILVPVRIAVGDASVRSSEPHNLG